MTRARLEAILAEAAAEVATWPDWMRSPDVKARLRELEERHRKPDDPAKAG